MWRKKEKKNPRTNFSLPLFAADDEPVSIDPAELESELMDILGENDRSTSRTIKSDRSREKTEKSERALLLDFVSDPEVSGSVEFDENDPELLAELEAFVSGNKKSTPSSPPTAPETSEPEQKSSSVSLSDVNDRLAAYRMALERLKKSEPAEAAKIRRYDRTIHQLEGYARDLSNGKSVDFSDLPPPPPASLLSDKSSAEAQKPSVKDVDLNALRNRLEEYKLAALTAEKEGNVERAQALVFASKMIEEVIPKIEAGLEPFDVETDLPPPPNEFEADETPKEPEPASVPAPSPPVPAAPSAQSQEDEKDSVHAGVIALKKRCQEYKLAALESRNSGNMERAKSLLQAAKMIEEVIPKVESGEEAFCAETDLPPPPNEFQTTSDDFKPSSRKGIQVPAAALSSQVTVENVKARLEYYQASLADAQNQPSEGSRQRRLGRIITQYKEALKACEHGISNFNYGELPPPPRCPTLVGPPVLKSGSSIGTAASSAKTALSSSNAAGSEASRIDRIVTLLTTRQSELKALALEAKQSGNMNLARNHLRAAMSINPMIESAQAGLAVDLSKLPRLPPKGSRSGEDSVKSVPAMNEPILTSVACDPPASFLLDLNAARDDQKRNELLLKWMHRQTSEVTELAHAMEKNGWPKHAQKLAEVIALCEHDKSYFHHCLSQQRPISYVFQWADLPSLNMNADLSDDVIEVTVVRGFAYPLPPKFTGASQVDTYVEVVFPFPSSEKPQKFSTSWCKHSVEPNYDATNKFEVDTKSRIYARIIQTGRLVKATVYYDAGLFKGPRPLGTATFSLHELGQSATIEPVADLMDGRRAVGGRLMLRFRQRTPTAGPTFIKSRKPWLTINVPKAASNNISRPHASREQVTIENRTPSRARESPRPMHSARGAVVRERAPDPSGNSHNYACLSVLRTDRDYFSRSLENPSLSDRQRQEYQYRLKEADKRYYKLKCRLQPGPNAEREMRAYLSELQVLQAEWEKLYQIAKARRNSQESEHYHTRLRLLTDELRELKSTLPH